MKRWSLLDSRGMASQPNVLRQGYLGSGSVRWLIFKKPREKMDGFSKCLMSTSY